MSSNSLGQDQTDILLFAEELADVKELLREASRQLLRIERRVKVAFPGAVSNRSRTRSSASSDRTRLDETAAREVINKLKVGVTKGEQIETKLRDYTVKPELQFIARLLGMTNTKLPPKDELVRRISTRLRQSVSVAAGIHDEAGAAKKVNQ